jgi:hypothetical protein
MAKRLSRKQLYELVWSEPMKILAPRFGISDVALKKTCARGGNSYARPWALGKKGGWKEYFAGGARRASAWYGR